METVEGKTFINERLLLDGKNFVRCHAIGCELVHAGAPFAHRDSTFENCKPVLAGDALYTKRFILDFGMN